MTASAHGACGGGSRRSLWRRRNGPLYAVALCALGVAVYAQQRYDERQRMREALDYSRMSAAAYDRLMTYYRREHKVSPTEADTMAMERYTLDGVPPHEVRWLALNTLLDADPAAAATIWRRIACEAGQ